MRIFCKRLGIDVPMMLAEQLAWLVGHEVSEKDMRAAEHPAFKNLRAALAPKLEVFGDVGVINVQGTLAYNPDPFEMLYDGVEDSRLVLKIMEEARTNPEVRGALIKMDTPGGMLLGGPEIADAVAAMEKVKPVVTHIGGLGASLGYMIASPSTQIIANRSAVVGSIGVISSVTDYSGMLEKMGIKFEYFTNKEAKFKSAGNIGATLTEDQRTYLQERVDSAFTLFKEMVLAKRPQVKAEAMQGQVFRGSEALGVGLVDAIGTESTAMGVLRYHIEKRNRT